MSTSRSANAAEDVPQAGHGGIRGVNLVALSVFWLPMNLFWTVMLQAFLPGRVGDIIGDAHKGTYLLYIGAIGAVATTVVQLVIGPLSDACASRWGRRHPFILVGTVASAFAIVAYAKSESFGALMVSFFAIQLFLNIATGPYQALIPDTVPETRHGVASAYMGAANLIGQLLGAVLLFGMYFFSGVLTLFNVLVGITLALLVGMAVTVLCVPDAPAPPEDRVPPGRALAGLAHLGLRENADFFGLLYSRFFINLGFYTVTGFLNYYLRDTIGPKEQVSMNQGIVIFIATISGLIGTVAVGRFADRIAKKRLVYYACALMALSAIIFAFITTMVQVFLLAAVFGCGLGAFAAVDWALAVNLLPRGNSAAKFMAVWHTCMTVPQILSPIFGPVGDALNAQYGHGFGWRAAMLSSVIYLVIGTALLRRVRERPVEVGAMQPLPAR